ncbi:MAG TPA: periplasmic heavy metal sensor [Thermoanaerobaculia bacterium]|nr:periplasmic heavy metal sensor [Thermoanaerobaculia bacterium]
MKRWWLVIALLLSLGVNVGILATVATSRLRPAPPPAMAPNAQQPPAAERLARLADRLGLEGPARERFIDLQRSFFLESGRNRMRLQEVYRQLRRELVSPVPDRQRIDRLVDESSRLYLAIERATTEHVLASRALLDPTQERIFLNLLRQMRPGRGPFAPPAAPGLPLQRRMFQNRPNQRPQPQPPPGEGGD